jgi:protein-disulfide isomerase
VTKAKRNRGATGRGPNSARALASARGGRNSKRTQAVAGAVVVVVVAVAVIGGVLYANSQKRAQNNAVIDVARTQARYPVTTAPGGVVVAGKDSAPVTVDAYEDFICPACEAFFQAFDGKMQAEIASGHLQVRYHMLNFLDKNSNPPGYSGRAAAASLAVAHDAPGKWADYYESLYRQQPEEHSAGYTNAQLISLGKRLGIDGGSFARDVKSGKYLDAVHEDYHSALDTVGKKFYGGGFATPTIVHDGKRVSYRTNTKPPHVRHWLSKLLQENGLQ